MLTMRYKGDTAVYRVSFNQISDNLVQIRGDMPIKTDGFVLSREGKNDDWDYTGYTTVYRETDDGVIFSADGTVYTAPVPLPPPDPVEPYVPTLDELKEAKVSEMHAVQQSVIQSGIDVTLTDGTTEHFTLTDQDQTRLMGLQTQVAQGIAKIPWHTSDQSEHCKYYSNADMALIVAAAMQYVTYHVTYVGDLSIYIRSLKGKEDVNSVVYGMPVPPEYQSEPLKDMLAGMS